MSYYLADRDGYLSELASINGYMEMKRMVADFLPGIEPLNGFLRDGETTDIENVIKDIETVLPRISVQSVKATLQELKINLSKAKEIAIVAQ